jgi:hypothetical protein
MTPVAKNKRAAKKGRADLKLVQKIAAIMEAGTIEEFIDVRSRPFRLIFWNFVIGLSRGIGFLLGATVVGAIIITVMKHAVVKLGGMPWLGEQIANAVIYIKQIVDQAPGTGQ